MRYLTCDVLAVEIMRLHWCASLRSNCDTALHHCLVKLGVQASVGDISGTIILIKTAHNSSLISYLEHLWSSKIMRAFQGS